MPNMRMTKNPMPSQDPNVRNKNFKEAIPKKWRWTKHSAA